jgi:hypothetical protein
MVSSVRINVCSRPDCRYSPVHCYRRLTAVAMREPVRTREENMNLPSVLLDCPHGCPKTLRCFPTMKEAASMNVLRVLIPVRRCSDGGKISVSRFALLRANCHGRCRAT